MAQPSDTLPQSRHGRYLRCSSATEITQGEAMILDSWTVFLLHFQRIWCMGQSLWSSPSCFFSHCLGYQNMVIDPKAAFRTVRHPSGQDTRRKKSRVNEVLEHRGPRSYPPIWSYLGETHSKLNFRWVEMWLCGRQWCMCHLWLRIFFQVWDGWWQGTQATSRATKIQVSCHVLKIYRCVPYIYLTFS